MIKAHREGREGIEMGVARIVVLVAAVGLLAGCGGSGAQTVNGCVIEPDTGCANLDLSGADLEGVDLSRADLSGANLENTNLRDATLVEADLGRAQLVNTNLSEADLTSASLLGATITATNLDGATFCNTVRTDGTIDDTGCSSTTDTTTTETTTTEVSEAEVSSFELTDLDCGQATTGPVTVTWATENATSVQVAVDTALPTPFPPSGSTTVVVPCDGEPHAITITPQNDSGPGVPDTKEVSSG